MTNLSIFFKLITLSFIILLSTQVFSQNGRSIDDEKYMKKQKSKHYRPSPEERSVMRIEKAQQKKEAKLEKQDYRLHKKAVRKHNKLINGGGKDLVDGKRTFKRMKKSKKQAKYTRE